MNKSPLDIIWFNELSVFATEVSKKCCFPFDNALLIPLPTQYNNENQKKLQHCIGGGGRGYAGEVLVASVTCPQKHQKCQKAPKAPKVHDGSFLRFLDWICGKFNFRRTEDQSPSQVGITTEIPSWKNYHKVFSALFEENGQRSNSPEQNIMMFCAVANQFYLIARSGTVFQNVPFKLVSISFFELVW